VYNKINDTKTLNQVFKNKDQRVRPLVFMLTALIFTIISVKPLAYVVCDPTCCDRSYKWYKILHQVFTSFLLR